jgi:hypothetical protein
LPVCFIRKLNVVEAVAACNCERGYYNYRRAEHEKYMAPLHSYFDLAPDVANNDPNATRFDIMLFHRRRLMKLNKELGRHYYDPDAEKWVFPDGVGFPGRDSQAFVTKMSDEVWGVTDKLKQEVEHASENKTENKSAATVATVRRRRTRKKASDDAFPF